MPEEGVKKKKTKTLFLNSDKQNFYSMYDIIHSDFRLEFERQLQMVKRRRKFFFSIS